MTYISIFTATVEGKKIHNWCAWFTLQPISFACWHYIYIYLDPPVGSRQNIYIFGKTCRHRRQNIYIWTQIFWQLQRVFPTLETYFLRNLSRLSSRFESASTILNKLYIHYTIKRNFGIILSHWAIFIFTAQRNFVTILAFSICARDL